MEYTASISSLIAALVGLMLLATVLLLIANHIKWPFTVLLVLAGLILHASGIDTLTGLDSFTQPEVATEIILVILLPTLIFESAFNLDSRRLKYNWRAIFTLAVPGTILSTLLIGALIGLLTPLPWGIALLLGAILSATDPISVISLFKKLNAPKDLTLLVEGESLFNDATAIIVSKLILAVMLTGIGMADAMLSSLLSFISIVAGGILIGGILGIAFAWLAGRVEDEPFVEITMTLVLAYGSYLLADFLGMSGILATVTAGLMVGGAGRPRLSTLACRYLENYWSYSAFAANALIFLLVGLRADLDMILGTGPLLLVVILAMLLSRAVVIYGLAPLVGWFSHHRRPISYSYRHLLFWGGIRGAITLALALSLESTFALGETIVALATGAVLFTVLVQGLSMGFLVRRLQLDKPETTDQLMRLEGWINAYRTAQAGVEKLKTTPELSTSSLDAMLSGLQAATLRLQSELKTLRAKDIDINTEWRLFLFRCFNIEITYLHLLSENGYLSESSYLRLRSSSLQQLDALRHGYLLPERNFLIARSKPAMMIKRCFLRKNEFQTWYAQEDYLEAWGIAQSCSHLLFILKEMKQEEDIPDTLLAKAQEIYQGRLNIYEKKIKILQATHPESIRSLGEQQLKYLIINTQRKSIDHQVQTGTLTEGMAEVMQQELTGEVMNIRKGPLSLLPARIAGLLSRTRPHQHTSHHHE